MAEAFIHGSECCALGQVWVHAEVDPAGRIRFTADSDSELTRGLAAVLVEALSGLTPDQVLQVRSYLCHQGELLSRPLRCAGKAAAGLNAADMSLVCLRAAPFLDM